MLLDDPDQYHNYTTLRLTEKLWQSTSMKMKMAINRQLDDMEGISCILPEWPEVTV
jgi:hypothetical protein